MERDKKDELLAYFMGQTNERLTAIEAKLVELIAFRAEVLSQAKSEAKLVSVVISLVVSIVLLAANVILKKMGML